MSENNGFDAFTPSDMAQKAEVVGQRKAILPFLNLFVLAILAGAFIALGAIFATTVTAGTSDIPFGISKLLAGLAFSLGLILVVVGGAELFTGNNLMMVAFLDKKITLAALLRNWIVVYMGNFLGSVMTAAIMFASQQYTFGKGSIGLNILTTANNKCGLEFFQAIALGIMCNALVCLAVWLCYSARTTADRILAIIPPITAFVAAGFEHSVANMYFIPIALFVKSWGSQGFWLNIAHTSADFPNITWSNFFLANLLPVTIGNIIGGALMVGAVYWFIFLRRPSK